MVAELLFLSPQKYTMQKIHSGHQRITKCSLPTSSVWWPGLKQLEHLIHNWPECSKVAKAPRQPIIHTPLPQHPWEKVASDLFEMSGKTYLLAVDYFKICRSPNPNQHIYECHQSSKAIFSRHSIPATLVSDNGPQEFLAFSHEYSFTHTTTVRRIENVMTIMFAA